MLEIATPNICSVGNKTRLVVFAGGDVDQDERAHVFAARSSLLREPLESKLK